MKEIKAYVRHKMADIVIRKLEEAGVGVMSVLNTNALAEMNKMHEEMMNLQKMMPDYNDGN